MSVDELVLTADVPISAGLVRPMECLREGWQLIKSDYWLFLGISVVGILIGSAVPMAILMGPMMCGIYLCLLRKLRGQQVRFEMLFKGFDYFLPSLIAMLLIMAISMVIILPVMVLSFIVVFAWGFALQPAGAQPDGVAIGTLIGLWAALYLLIMLLSFVMHVFVMFVFPLIVDRKLSGGEALRLSIRAGRANFMGLFGLVLLTGLLGTVGLLACYVGAFLVLPISFAATAVAYRRVFPSRETPLSPELPETGIVAAE